MSDYIKLKNLCASRNTIKNAKAGMEWERIFANHVSDKGLISRIKNYNSNTKNKQLIKIWAKDLNRLFSKENVQMRGYMYTYS